MGVKTMQFVQQIEYIADAINKSVKDCEYLLEFGPDYIEDDVLPMYKRLKEIQEVINE